MKVLSISRQDATMLVLDEGSGNQAMVEFRGDRVWIGESDGTERVWTIAENPLAVRFMVDLWGRGIMQELQYEAEQAERLADEGDGAWL